ncbi:MAG: ShlB/FhaC/HecB family hemolysin secretion/activation protein, partial [Candidatus Omnitrophica bacterium]|nr:ShlB/FhaC/HecB family hemolysin secretion/activation protein [Candidatus Omnitrophota bacterium]
MQIKDHKYFNKKRISYYWELEPGEILEYYKISRSLQFINRNPDREANATLFAGKKPGTTDILLNVDTYFPIHMLFSFDREGAVSTSKDRWGFGIRHNNILGLDDTVLAGYSPGKRSNNIYAYHSLPLTNFGTSLMYGFTRSESFPKKDFESFDLRSYAKTGSCFIYQDIYKRDKYLGQVQFGLDGSDKTVYTKDGVLNRDRIRVLRLGGEFVIRWLNSVTYIKPSISQGVNLFGARRKSPLSSRDAENTFTKANIGFRYRKPIPPAFQMNVKSKVQFASEKLPPQEEFSFGGINSVRGYPSGDYYADNAIQVSAEFLVPPLFLPEEIRLPYAERPLKEDITGLIFFDYGYGTKRGERQGEDNEQKLAGIGIGLRMHLFNQALLRLEWGFPIEMGDKPISETANSRFYISLNFEDRIPQEIERIRKMMERENIEQAAWNI